MEDKIFLRKEFNSFTIQNVPIKCRVVYSTAWGCPVFTIQNVPIK